MVDVLDRRERFVPNPGGDVPPWVNEAFRRIYQDLDNLFNNRIVEPVHAEPTQKYDGLTEYADGEDWDPGHGRGIYYWDSNIGDGEWVYMGKVNFDPGQLDAFGRQRVSQITTLIDVKHPNDKNADLVDEEIINTGASVHSAADAGVTMSTSASGDAVIRQTFQRAPYYAGKSQQFLFTFDNLQADTNVIKRVGCFNSSFTTPFDSNRDGLFLEASGGDHHLVVSDYGTETARISRSNWDDPLDGTGPSGATIDWTKSQILSIDFEYLGVGGVRFFFVIDQQFVLAHQYNHANAGNSTYMRYSNQPIRYEIRQTGAGSGSMLMVCATAGTEGASNKIGIENGVNNGDTAVEANSTSSVYAMLGVRLDVTKPNVTIRASSVTVLALTNDAYQWGLFRNPTVAGTFTYSSDGNIEAAIGSGSGNTITGGTLLASGYGQTQSAVQANPETAIKPGIAIDGTPDEIVLAVRPLSVNLDILGAFNWVEEL